MKILKEVVVRYQTEDGRIVKAYEQEEVTRCKDCTHRYTSLCMARDALYTTKDTDYCSWGDNTTPVDDFPEGD